MARVRRSIEDLSDVVETGVYTVGQVARVLQRSEEAVREDIRAGRLPAVRFERGYRVAGRVILELFGERRKLYTQAEMDQAVREARDAVRAEILGEIYRYVRDAGGVPASRLEREA